MESLYLYFEHYLKKVNNIYDLYLIVYLLLKKHEGYITTLFYGNVDKVQDTRNWINKNILAVISDINLSSIIKEKIFNSYDEKERDPLFLLSLFMELDYKYGYRDEFLRPSDGNTLTPINPLNTENTYQFGFVYYVTKSFFDNFFDASFPRRRLDSKKGASIENFQSRLNIIRHEEFTDYYINFSVANYQSILDKLMVLEELRIGFVPLTNRRDFLIERIDGNQFFIEGIRDEEIFIKKIIKTLDNMSKHMIDIAIFPEMAFTSKMLNEVKNYLHNNKNKLLFVVCGSIWEDRTNKCVLLSGSGIEISTQIKNNPFHKTCNFDLPGNNEGIDVSKRTLNILDFGGLGRLCTPICVDFIIEDSFKFLMQYGVNTCFIPSYSSKTEEFVRFSKRLISRNNGVNFFNNCCSALSGSEDICFVDTPLVKTSKLPALEKKFKYDSCTCSEEGVCFFMVHFGNNHCEMDKICYNEETVNSK